MAAVQQQQHTTPSTAANQAVMNNQQVAATTPYSSASLYVGDLSPDVTETNLFELFNSIGAVASVRVCRDAATRRSLGYAYVNFNRAEDASKVLDVMNFQPIKGKECRIMWSHRDPSLRRSGQGNIFIRNLAPSIDNKTLFDTFSIFGEILSCKVATNAKGKSLGYGFVHYLKEEDANKAIEKVDGNIIADRQVQVQRFKSKSERGSTRENFTNVYVKNLPREWSDEQHEALFSKYGDVTKSFVARDEEGKCRGFGFANYADPENAKKAIRELNDTVLPEMEAEAKQRAAEAKKTSDSDDADAAATKKASDSDDAEDGKKGDDAAADDDNENENESKNKDPDSKRDEEKVFVKPLVVCRAQKREERERELRRELEARKIQRQKQYANVNLYVKNLDESIDEARLHELFSDYGKITSARVMMDETKSKSRGFGFVCFSTPTEATNAVQGMNGKMVENKPLYVALAQRKEVRRAQLEQYYANRNKMGYPGAMYPGYGNNQMYYNAAQLRMAPMPMPMMQQQAQHQAQQQQQRGGPAGNRWAGLTPQQQHMMMMQQYGGFPANPMLGVQQQQQQQQQGGGRGSRNNGRRGGKHGGANSDQGDHQQKNFQYTSEVRNPQAQQQQQQVQQQQQQQQRNAQQGSATTQPLTSQILSAAPENQQKQMIGERLYPLIAQRNSVQAGKITGMLLEMDNFELLHLLEMPAALDDKIQEALDVLRRHTQQS